MNTRLLTQPLTRLRTKMTNLYQQKIQRPLNAVAGAVSRRWQAMKAWLARKKRTIIRRVVLTITVFVAAAILFYLYRRSATARTLLNSLADSLISFPAKLRQWLKRWRRPDQTARPKPATTIVIGDDRRTEVPVRPGVNSPEA